MVEADSPVGMVHIRKTHTARMIKTHGLLQDALRRGDANLTFFGNLAGPRFPTGIWEVVWY